MLSVFEFSNWNQIAGLRSKDYPYLKLTVDQFESSSLIGTKINIIDTSNNLTYFSGFIRVVESAVFNPMAVFEVDEIIKRINSYGFNIVFVEPTTLPPEVITILKGLQELGYNFLSLQYQKTYATNNKEVYEYVIDNKYKPSEYPNIPETELKTSPYAVVRNKFLIASKYLKDMPNFNQTYDNIYQPNNLSTYVVSKSPEFNWEDFKWVKPNTIYSISEVLENYTGG